MTHVVSRNCLQLGSLEINVVVISCLCLNCAKHPDHGSQGLQNECEHLESGGVPLNFSLLQLRYVLANSY